MNILFLSPGPDTAGLGIAMKRAFDACAPDWHARAVRLWDSPWHYPADIQWDREDPAQTEEVMALWRAADVVHIFEQAHAAAWFPDFRHKTIVCQHLGTYYRSRPAEVREECRSVGAFECADMHDLVAIDPRLPWLPDIVDIDALAAVRRREWHPSRKVRISHAPTDRRLKGTEHILPAIERLARRYPIELDLIEGVGNEECLVRKARTDIHVDSLMDPGLNACEAWAMGLPVVCGFLKSATRDLMLRDLGELPFVEADASNVEERIERLVADPDYRAYWGAAGYVHVVKWHSQSAVVARAIGLYERAMRGQSIAVAA